VTGQEGGAGKTVRIIASILARISGMASRQLLSSFQIIHVAARRAAPMLYKSGQY